MTAKFKLSAFGDEICDDLAEQLGTLVDLRITQLDLRAAWGKGVTTLSDAEIATIRQMCSTFGITISCLASPVGKTPLVDPIQFEQERLERLVAIGNSLDTNLVRIFSFYPPDMSTNLHYDQYIPEVIERLAHLTRLAESEGFILLLENEKGIVTDTPERCRSVLEGVHSPALGCVWDSANYVQVEVATPVERGWAGLEPYLQYVHIKDALLADGSVTPAGEGDGQLPELLKALKAKNYQGTLSLEPHLKIAGHSSGFSGPDGMQIAASALRKLMKELGCREV
jgi:sugar phosphate isomerase/epimerase